MAYSLTVLTDGQPFLENLQQTYVLQRGLTLFNNLALNGVKTQAKCGGKGLCGGCRIKIVSQQKYCNTLKNEEKGMLSQQEINDGWRLACQLHCLRDVTLLLPAGD